MAIDVEAFVPLRRFRKEIDLLIKEIKSTPVRPGFKEVLLPGELEYRAMTRRKKEGIPVDDTSWSIILQRCREIGADTSAMSS
jgi:L-2-hydroxycarboxylate dehydrogenase (NAD+)